MKKQYIAAFCCILVASCSKAELNDVKPGLLGEKITVAVPAQTIIVPAQTKAAISGNTYVFEGDEQIIAVASNGSKATLTNSEGLLDNFTGTFDKPVTDDSTISFYYNAESIAEDGAASFAQNGKPWLLSKHNSFTRNENNEIVVSATLAAPENVRAIAVITSDSGIENLEFHAKDTDVRLGTFNGTAFDGESSVTQTVLSHGELGNSNIFYVPKDMEGGFWIKAIKGGEAMYKSYASSEIISTNKTVTISQFEPATVAFDITISGFATSYSYYVGEDGFTQSVETANATANDWMGSGKAVCTITKSGIPSTLLSVKSVSLFVNGTEFSGIGYTVGNDNTISINETIGHTTWEQKNITVAVVYTTPDGVEFKGTSNTLTRHITGLPYSANPPKNSGENAWSESSWNVKWESSSVQLGAVTGSGEPSIKSPTFNMPATVDITIKSDVKADKYTFLGREIKTTYNVYANGTNVSSKEGSFSRTTLSANTSFSSGSNSLKCESSYKLAGPSVTLFSVNILYR